MLNYQNNTIIASSIILLLAVSVPNGYSNTFDEETCLSLISIDKVKEITKFDGALKINVINSNLETLNEGIAKGCAVAFQNDDTSFSLSLGISAAESEEIAQSKYGEIFSASHRMGYDVIEGNNGPWIHHLVEVNDIGIGSVLGSIKDNILIGINSPQTDIQIESSSMLEILKVIQSNAEELKIPKSYTAESNTDANENTSSNGAKIIFEGCDDEQIWFGHVENDKGEKVYDASITVYNQANEVWAELDVNQKHGNFGVSTTGQDPSTTAGRIQATIGNEPPIFYDSITCDQTEPIVADQPSGGGCLIATAAYGSELAPQVQALREIRDNSLLNTESGTSFMSTFNGVYYSFSPIIADYERENPMFREMVKIAITPMISSLSILNHVDMDSEQSVVGYGISLVVLNLAMYLGIPASVIMGARKLI